jgi:hypothetical protein
MAHGAITAADNMNDLRQKTGVSVEALSQFGRAAEMSGTTIDGVAGAMAKLARGMTATKGPAVDAMHSMGIASRDASGNLRSVDDVMLEVADKFKTMPDGAEKTALAIGLFGKAGADMIPMLNMGSAAIKELGRAPGHTNGCGELHRLQSIGVAVVATRRRVSQGWTVRGPAWARRIITPSSNRCHPIARVASGGRHPIARVASGGRQPVATVASGGRHPFAHPVGGNHVTMFTMQHHQRPG